MKVARKYQREMLKYGLEVKHPAFFADMRLGKSYVTVEWLDRTLTAIKKQLGLVSLKILIVSPISAFDGWETEFSQEAPKIKVSVIYGSKKERDSLIINDGVNIINPHGVRMYKTDLYKLNSHIIILDESTMIKNPKSIITKKIMALKSKTLSRCILSGTPDPKNDLDFVQQLIFLNYAILGVKSYYEFRHKYCNKGYYGNYTIKPEYRERFRELLKKYCFFVRRSDVNLGGTHITVTKTAIMCERSKHLYAKLEKDMILEAGETLTTMFTMQKRVWSRLLASGIVDGVLKYRHKINTLLEIVDELNGKPFIVWAVYTAEINIIVSELRKYKIKCGKIDGSVDPMDRKGVQGKFLAGELQSLVIQPETFKYGVDLSVSDTNIYFSIPENTETYRQTKDRIVKVVNTHSLYTIHIVTKNTVDEDISECTKENIMRADVNHYMAKRIKERVKYA